VRFRQIIVVAGLMLPGSVALAHAETRKELIVGDTPLTPAQERVLKPRDSFRECENCPAMVVIPEGAFTMGSPKREKDRWEFFDDEGPQHVVTIGRSIAVGKLHVTPSASLTRLSARRGTKRVSHARYAKAFYWRNEQTARGAILAFYRKARIPWSV
jgi:formylglycine-generating enzyme required for sulfatase activity